MDFVKQFASPGGKGSAAKAATTDEGGVAPPALAHTPAAAIMTTAASAPAVGGGARAQDAGDGDETPPTTTTLGQALGKTLKEVQQGGGAAVLGPAQLAAYGRELGTAAAAERARAPHKDVAALGRDVAGEAWDHLHGGDAKTTTAAAAAATKTGEALRGDDDDGGDAQPQQPKDNKAGGSAHKPVTRSSAAGLGSGGDGNGRSSKN